MDFTNHLVRKVCEQLVKNPCIFCEKRTILKEKGEYMVYVGAVGIGVPKYEISQQEVKRLVSDSIFAGERKLKRLLPVFDHAMVDQRQIVVDQEWFQKSHTWEETNELYQYEAKKLVLKAVDACLEDMNASQVTYSDVDLIIYVSSTGIATPSMDVHLFNERNFREDVVRMPLWGLGCAGGAMGIARGTEWLKLHRDKVALIVCCELCSLTFQKQDVSTSNIVGTALFGDGAGATLLFGEEAAKRFKVKKPLPYIVSSSSYMKKDSMNVMGWKVRETGLEVVFSKRIPQLVKKVWQPHAKEYLQQEGITVDKVKDFIAHPGGRKVLEEMASALTIEAERLHHTYAILRHHGNMSSATVLYVLQRYLQEGEQKQGTLALLSALGPGFSSEMMLMEWRSI